jgi:hypothetical protein
MTTLLLFCLYALITLAAAAVARLLKTSIPLRLLLLFFLLPLIFFAPVFFAGRTILPMDHLRLAPWTTGYAPPHNPYLNDVVTQFVPWAKAAREAWSEGSLPLRNRWNGCGTALAANGSSAAFSPLMLVSLLLPLAEGFALAAAAKLFVALAGTWLWLKSLRASDGAALFAALAFSFSLSMTPWILFPQTALLCLWPWCLFAIEKLRDPELRRRAFWLLAGVFILWPLSGHIETAASGAAFAGLWLLARFVARDLPGARSVFPRALLAGAIALGSSAFSLLPQVHAIVASNRIALAQTPFWSASLSWLPHGPAWPNGLFTPFFPRTLGDGFRSPIIDGAIGSFPEMALAYFGIAGWAAALLILRPGPRGVTPGTLLVPLVVGLGAAIGLWPFAELVSLLPGLNLMYPLRFFSWVALAGAGIAALELDRLVRDARANRKVLLVPAAIAAGLALFALAAFARFRGFHLATGGHLSQKRALAAALLFLAFFALLPALFAFRRLAARRGFLAPALALLCAADLFYQGKRLYSFGRTEAPPKGGAMLSFLRSQPRPFRVAAEGTFLFPNTNILAGVEDIRTHDPVERRDYVEFLDSVAGYTPGDYFKWLRNLHAPALDSLNVRYLLTRPKFRSPGGRWVLVYEGSDGAVYENPDVRPRVFSADSRASVSAYTERTNSASFRASVALGTGDSLLATSLVQDGGWSAIDGKGRRLRTTTANGPFLALSLPPGRHEVRLRYLPPGFGAGLMISLATLAALLAALLARRRVGRQDGP